MITPLNESNTKTMKYKLYDEVYDLGLYVDRYANYDNLYIGLVDAETGEDFADLSINIEPLPEDYICLSGDFQKEHEALIKKYKLGTFTGEYSYSGYGKYPIYKMNMDVVRQYQVI